MSNDTKEPLRSSGPTPRGTGFSTHRRLGPIAWFRIGAAIIAFLVGMYMLGSMGPPKPATDLKQYPGGTFFR